MSEKITLDKLLSYWNEDKENRILASQIIDEYMSSGDFGAGIRFFEELSGPLKNEFSLVFRQSNLLMAMGDFDKAETELEKIYTKMPSHIQVAYNLAYARYALHRFDQAYEVLRLVIAQWQECPETLVLIARCLRMLNGAEAGIDYVKQYLKVRENDIAAMSLLSLLYSEIGHHEAALALAEQLLNDNQDLIDALTAVSASAVALKRYDKAEQWLEIAIRRYPDATAFWVERGVLGLLKADFDKAESYFRKVIDLGGDGDSAYYFLGISQLVNDSYEAASESFNEALCKNPEHADSYGGLAICQTLSGHIDAAEGNIDIALSKDKNSIIGLLAKSVFFQKKGNLEEAERVRNNLLSFVEVQHIIPFLDKVYEKFKDGGGAFSKIH